MLQEILLDGGGQPRRGTWVRYYDGLEPAARGTGDLPPVVEFIVQDVHRLTCMKTTKVDCRILLLDEALQLWHLDSLLIYIFSSLLLS